jgi:very-short-patch-repair endonuclease
VRRSAGELAFEAQLRGLRGHHAIWMCEYQFAPPRKWRFDFACPLCKLAVEIDGSSVGGAGRHAFPQHREKDNEKFNEAALRGWTVFHGTTKQAENGWLLEWIAKYLKQPRMLIVPFSTEEP